MHQMSSEILTAVSKTILSSGKYFALKMAALQPFKTSGTARPVIQHNIPNYLILQNYAQRIYYGI
jgi:hypothetical protein